jgi:hypothetical protein
MQRHCELEQNSQLDIAGRTFQKDVIIMDWYSYLSRVFLQSGTYSQNTKGNNLNNANISLNFMPRIKVNTLV